MTNEIEKLGESESDLINIISRINDIDKLKTIIEYCQIAMLTIPFRDKLRAKINQG